MKHRAESEVGEDAAQYIVLNKREEIMVRGERKVDVRSMGAYSWVTSWAPNARDTKSVGGF
jgi:hypothetical protein